MEMKHSFFGLIYLFAGTLAVHGQDHGHLNVGVVGRALAFDNGGEFGDPYVKTLIFTNTGKFANVYNGNITLTSLHSTNAFGELDPAAPKPGTFVVGEIVSVQGPPGGEFGFWETNSTITAAINVPVGATNVGFRFALSEAGLGAGLPGGDAFGHIHGRRFTVTTPGLYRVGFRAHDVSANGTGGAPIYAPSEVLVVNFQGGVNIAEIEPDVSHVHVTFGALAGYAWQVQFKNTLGDVEWKDVDSPVIGTDLLVEVQNHLDVGFSGFYRVVGTVVPP